MLAFFLLLSCDVKAAENDLSELGEAYGVKDVYNGLDYSAADFLEENGITPDNAEGITSLSPSVVISYMFEKLRHSSAAPLKLFGIILSVIILAAAGGAAADISGNKSGEKVYRIISVLAVSSVVIPPLEQCFDNAFVTIQQGGEFMLCYVPVFAGICTASGSMTSSASYSAVMLMTAQAAVKLVSELVMPVISLCLAMSIIDAINPTFSLSAITELFRKWLSIILGFIMTIFTGMLSMQSVVGAAADTLGIKAAKFMASNLIPVVGSAVAEAYSTMRSGLGLLRGAAGAFGIIALAVTLLPPVLEAACLYLVMTAAGAASEMFGASELSCLFRGAASALSLILAVLSCFCVMFVISTIILMAAGLGSV